MIVTTFLNWKVFYLKMKKKKLKDLAVKTIEDSKAITIITLKIYKNKNIDVIKKSKKLREKKYFRIFKLLG